MCDGFQIRLVPTLARFGVWRSLGWLALLLLAAHPGRAAEAKASPHPFAGLRGEIINAEIVQVKDGEVVIKRTDGKVFALDLPLLNETDRAYVQKWRAATTRNAKATEATTESDLEMSVSLEPLIVAGKAVNPGAFTPRVTLRNRETTANFQGLKCTLVLVGQSTLRPTRFKVLAVDQFQADVGAGAAFTALAQPFWEQSVESASAEFMYRGYFIVLQNAEGNIIQMQREGPFPKSGTEVLKLTPGAVFTARAPGRAFRLSSAPRRLNGTWPAQTSVLPLHLIRPSTQ